MAVIDRIKWDGDPTLLAWKFPSQELSTWSQLIVNETQEAYLVHSGVYEGPFGAGRHTLETENLPVLRGVMGLPFGGKSPFSAEVWFVNRAMNLALLWGSRDPIQLQDPKYDILVPVSVNCQYGIRIKDAKQFLLKLVGTLTVFDVNNLKSYFDGVLSARIKQSIATAIIEKRISVLEASAHIEELSEALLQRLQSDFDEFGIELTQFNIRSFYLPENDPAVAKLKSALARKAELNILGLSIQQDRSFDVLQTAAGNEGASGGVMGAGIGLGMGAGIGSGISQSMTGVSGVMTTSNAQTGLSMEERISKLEKLAEMKDKGIINDEEFSKMKGEVLGS